YPSGRQAVHRTAASPCADRSSLGCRDQAGPRFFETRKAPLPPDGGSIRQSGDRDDSRLARRWTSCASKSRSLGTLPIICVFESCFLSIRPLGTLTSSHSGAASRASVSSFHFR